MKTNDSVTTTFEQEILDSLADVNRRAFALAYHNGDYIVKAEPDGRSLGHIRYVDEADDFLVKIAEATETARTALYNYIDAKLKENDE